MNLRDLEYIVAVADRSSFSKAAAHCKVSQPTLSTQLKKFEEYLGVTLFERNNKRVKLTDAGTQIVTIARRMLSDGENILELAKNCQDPLGGLVKIGAIPTLASYVFPALVQQMRKLLPQAKIILSEDKTSDLVSKLSNGEIDFALAAMPIHHSELANKKLFDDPFYLAVGAQHPLAKQKQVSLSQLQDFELLLLEEGHCLGDQALALCSATGMRVATELRATSLE
ncbi:MAG: LysR family transcriptional regulator, partial [Bdellovibrionales bacterium]|nr:LysR family transcriptional regulator [Bdellovibrionales bacterium]